MQRICRSAALLTALTVTSGACRYLAGDTCDDDACLPNQPPVAVISGVEDGALRVGNASEVLVSARDSSDPDGDVLSYAWQVEDPCAGQVIGDLTSEDLRLDNLPGGATCLVTLTVTDPSAKTGTAQATLVIRNVGAHVTSTGNACIASFDPDSDAPQGTASTPFCSIDQAVIAANTFHLGEISMDGGAHTYTGRLLLDFPVTLRGGYQANSTDWVASGTGVTTTVVLQQSGAGAIDAQVSVTSNVTVGFKDVTVRRSGQCRSDCVLVSATDASLSFDNVVLGSASVLTNATANDAENVSYSSIAMSAQSAARAKSLVASDLKVYGSANATRSIGISLDGAVSANLTNVAVFERALISAAIRMTRALEVSVVNPSIDILAAGGPGSQGYGIADGNRSTIIADVCPTGSVVCDGSASLQVEGGSIAVTNAEIVMGINTQGTGEVQVKGTKITVDGQQAWGIFGSASTEVSLADLTVGATTRRSRGDIEAFAVGVSDNLDALGAEAEGSKAFHMSDGSVQVDIVGTDIDRAAGLNLAYTESARVSGTTFAIRGTAPASAAADSAVGVRLLGTSDVLIADASVELVGMGVRNGAAGVVDGEPLRIGDEERPGSRNVTLRNVDVLTDVGADLLATAACVVMVATEGGTIEGDRGPSMTCRASGAAASYGVFLSKTRNVTMRATNVAVGSATVALPIFGSTYVGVHDGGLTASQTDEASENLTITGNRISLTQVDGQQIGIRFRGAAIGNEPVIDDNFIKVSSSTRNVGVLLQQSHATVALNTLRLQGCSGVPCAPAYAVGIYIMHSEAYTSSFLGNVIGVMDGMSVERRPAFVRHNYLASGWDANIGIVTANVFGDEVDSSEPSFVAGIASDSDDITSPASMAGYSVTNVPGTGNVHASPSYCPDGVHGRPTSAQRGAASMQMPVFGVDIDGESRKQDGLDAGADLIVDPCP